MQIIEYHIFKLLPGKVFDTSLLNCYFFRDNIGICDGARAIPAKSIPRAILLAHEAISVPYYLYGLPAPKTEEERQVRWKVARLGYLEEIKPAGWRYRGSEVPEPLWYSRQRLIHDIRLIQERYKGDYY